MVERASVRLRTTVLAVAVMAVALIVGAVTLVLMARSSLRGGIETAAEERAAVLAAQIQTSGLPSAAGDDDDDDDVLWQVRDGAGAVVRSSRPLAAPLPAGPSGQVRLPGQDDPFVIVTGDAGAYTVVVAASLDEVDDATGALVTPLAIGVPLVLMLVGGVTWLVVTRALAPVERIRREVEEITGERLDRRVPEPASRDEVHRLARTMNRMLARLEDSRERQQRFVADASHELRSPLAGIRQAAEVARSHPGALSEGELAEAVLEESGRMERLVEQLLLLTRTGGAGAGARPRQDVDVDDLALAEARRVRRTGLTVDSSGVGAGRVRGDRSALAQVVRNLADNGARHARTTVAVAVSSRAGRVDLVVEDDGAGIPEDQRERVFERFVRLDEARARDDGGSGLGLAIVREIVGAHGGTVTVTRSALGGARFEVRLPAS
ncbi:ATP-binding protein [Actinoplanes sp. NEAU-A12]|uniref:histidine kinase n=1 Tax=Actinoplanes sandaracinus TaxID=3045177 RepID=A0ABT6X103_9ACTN|nr:ATP-binding protein [Actinoplanes sandaracinus]MDI6105675.1 ATP-binding protein [Actinoplanes sandaracinus]